jgi:soluble lytic murein transglycosylase-like protein
VQAENQSHFFPTKAAAIRWVQQAQAQGISSIDVGCMQVNLMYHPTAFKTLDDAFDPAQNADYAARFLISLHAQTRDWQQAAGQYHSQTLALAIPYPPSCRACNQSDFAPASPGTNYAERRTLKARSDSSDVDLLNRPEARWWPQ